MRTAVVTSPDPGGAFDVLFRLVRYGLGGTSGSGKQFVSWITDHDFVLAVNFVIENHQIEDPVNFAAPNPLPNQEFMRALGQAWGIPVGLPATEWMLELTSIPMQTESELILKSRRVVPGKLNAAGFQFDFPD
jgi:NAD dependent epimerase/dehydratase family enzyme